MAPWEPNAAGSRPLTFQQLAFQEVPDATPGRRRLHLDVHGPDPDGLRAHAESLGAVFVVGHDIGDFHWDVMHEPEGNEFCIARD
ncbi:VOC family protein [Arthrobacter sp. NPDC093128]|uniref:VOC family protein n=1 Tax=Arthrobacter sp. NPDC093128 TaxID=3154979 RepID=UPI00343BDE85